MLPEERDFCRAAAAAAAGALVLNSSVRCCCACCPSWYTGAPRAREAAPRGTRGGSGAAASSAVATKGCLKNSSKDRRSTGLRRRRQ